MTVCLLKRKLNTQRYGENHGEAIMNLANSRRKMKEDLFEAQMSLSVSHGASLMTSDVTGGPSCVCLRTHTSGLALRAPGATVNRLRLSDPSRAEFPREEFCASVGGSLSDLPKFPIIY